MADGYLGLVLAAGRWDPARGPFATLAWWEVRRALSFVPRPEPQPDYTAPTEYPEPDARALDAALALRAAVAQHGPGRVGMYVRRHMREESLTDLGRDFVAHKAQRMKVARECRMVQETLDEYLADS